MTAVRNHAHGPEVWLDVARDGDAVQQSVGSEASERPASLSIDTEA